MNTAFRTANMMNVRQPMFSGRFIESAVAAFQSQNSENLLPKDMGVILTTAKTAIQFQPDAIACILDLTLVVLISVG